MSEANYPPPQGSEHRVSHSHLISHIIRSTLDLIKESAKIFGFNRIGGNVETSMAQGINKAVNRGFAMIEADRVFLKE